LEFATSGEPTDAGKAESQTAHSVSDRSRIPGPVTAAVTNCMGLVILTDVV